MAAASSLTAAAYLTWHINSEGQKIALDSSTSPKDVAPVAKALQVDQPPQPTPSSAELPVLDAQAEAPESDGEESSSGGAFDPVTGKINWDCSCLGGMAYGPCGMQFREAFSCFVFSEEEPKGIDCVEKFKAMQDCFRANPEVYGEEILGDDDDDIPAPATPPEDQADLTVTGTAPAETSSVPTLP